MILYRFCSAVKSANGCFASAFITAKVYKVEERAGADARRLFEAFLRKIHKLEEASASH
jgi:hypothetical protein